MTYDRWLTSGCEYPGDDAPPDDERDDDMMDPDGTTPFKFDEWLATATDLQLKSARYALDREEKRRVEAAKETLRAFDPKARAKRSDAGKTRERKEAAA